jgi:hypothetical protein
MAKSIHMSVHSEKPSAFSRAAFKLHLLAIDPNERNGIMSRNHPENKPEHGQRIVALGESLTRKMAQKASDMYNYGPFQASAPDGACEIKTVCNSLQGAVSLELTTHDKTHALARFVFHYPGGETRMHIQPLITKEDGVKRAFQPAYLEGHGRDNLRTGPLDGAVGLEIYLDNDTITEKPEKILPRVRMRPVDKAELQGIIGKIQKEDAARGIVSTYDDTHLPNEFVTVNPFKMGSEDIPLRMRSEGGALLDIDKDSDYCSISVQRSVPIWTRAIIVLRKIDGESEAYECEKVDSDKMGYFKFGFEQAQIKDVTSMHVMFIQN